MRPLQLAIAVSALCSLGLAAHAQSPITATCKGGTAYSGATRSGALVTMAALQASERLAPTQARSG